MTFSPHAARSITTPNMGSRGGRKIDHIVLHHMATTNGSYVEQLMHSGSKEVSANYIQRNSGELVGVVPEESRSWSLSSSEWDGRSITVETENESADGWTISAAASESLARLVADVCTRHSIPCNRDRVIGHREVYTRHGASYATACPGGLDLDGIVARAQEIMSSSTADDDITELPKPLEFGMAQRMYFARIDADGNDNGEWMIAGADIPAHPTDPKQDGYRVTIDKEEAKVWARQYSFAPVGTRSVQLVRDLYIKQQEFARKDAAEWRAGVRALLSA